MSDPITAFINGTAKIISDIFSAPKNIITDTSGKISSGFEKTISSGESVITTGLKSGENVLTSGINAYVDTERSITKGLVNVAGDIGHTGRFLAKNGVGLLDNVQDQFFQTVADIRSDVTNTIQIVIFLAAIGIAAGAILYGDKILDRGVKMAGITLG